MQRMKVTDQVQDGLEHDIGLVDWAQLRRLMEFQDVSTASLARMCNMPLSTLRKMFSGETEDPRISSILPVCRALGASLDRLIGLAPKRDLAREEAVYDSTLMDNMRNQLAGAEQQRAVDAQELDRLRKLVLAKGEACSCAESKLAAISDIIHDRDASIARRDAIIAQRDAEIDELSNKIDNQSVRLEAKAQRIQEQAEQISRKTAQLEGCDATIKRLENTNARLRKVSYILLAALLCTSAVIAYLAWEIANIDQGLTGMIYKDLFR